MLVILTIVAMAVITYAFWQEGMFTACATCINVFFAGLVAFNFFEPIAAALEPSLADSFLAGYEDCFVLTILFCLTLGLLRFLTNTLSHTDLDYSPLVLRGGTVVFGLLTGYLVSGFLIATFHTLPFPQTVSLSEEKLDADKRGRRLLPPDRVWLAMMHRAGVGPFAWGEGPTFDKYANFEMRCRRYRRLDEKDKFKPNDGACQVK